MKRIFSLFLLAFVSISLFATELSDGSVFGTVAIAVNGELPSGYFSKASNYLPGDNIAITNPNSGVTINVLNLGVYDSEENVLLLTPEVAKKLDMDLSATIRVKLSSRPNDFDEIASGSAVLSFVEKDIIPQKEEPVATQNNLQEEPEADLSQLAFLDEPKNNADIIEEDVAESIFVEEEPYEDIVLEEIAEENLASQEIEDNEEALQEPLIQETEEYISLADDEWILFEDEEPEFDAPESSDKIALEKIPESSLVQEFFAKDSKENVPEESKMELVSDADLKEELFLTPMEQAKEEKEEEEPKEVETLANELPVMEQIPESEIKKDFIPEVKAKELATDKQELEYVPESLVQEVLVEALITEEPKVQIASNDIVQEIEESLPEEDLINEEDELEEVEEKEPTENEKTLVTLIPSNPIVPPATEKKAESNKEEKPAPKVEPQQDSKVEPKTDAKKQSNYASSEKDLKKNSYYVQIATVSDSSVADSIIAKYSKYPFTVMVADNNKGYKVLVGPLNANEYGAILAKFKAYGYKDAFVKNIK